MFLIHIKSRNSKSYLSKLPLCNMIKVLNIDELFISEIHKNKLNI